MTKIGSYEWILATHGQLSFKEKLQLLNKIMVPSVIGSLKTSFYRYGNYKNSLIDLPPIPIPDTPMVKSAIETLESKANIALINHSWRTYFWGAALAHLQNQDFDPEILLIAALFHDMGLTGDQLKTKKCQCFTYESVHQFNHKAKEAHFDENKSNIIQDAICHHMNAYVDDSYPVEVTLLQQGASCDVIGDQLHKVPLSYRDEVLKTYPREKFNSIFKTLLEVESKNNPNSRTALLRKLGLPLLITLNPFQE